MPHQTYGHRPFFSSQIAPSQKRVAYTVIKRFLDLTLALIILVLSLPLMIFIAIAIVLDSPGSPILVQQRVGKDGKLFSFYKFRSMRPAPQNDTHYSFMKAYINGYANGDGDEMNQTKKDALFKPQENDRVTKIGQILRKTSLDELPQLFNIILGDMSFIGPRPPIHYEVEAYKAWHFRRFEALPGITGLAQINGRSQIPFADIVQWDIQYIENQSLLLDLLILLRTVPTVLRGKGSG
jgi:lipopolysaccharide/colanic/teichoic acid biosynthesis glycosyltransferase